MSNETLAVHDQIPVPTSDLKSQRQELRLRGPLPEHIASLTSLDECSNTALGIS
jgi:hypothetical protein